MVTTNVCVTVGQHNYRHDRERTGMTRQTSLHMRHPSMYEERRTWLGRQLLLLSSIAAFVPSAEAAPVLFGGKLPPVAGFSTTETWTEIKAPIVAATDTLEKLVQNWERAVIDCMYADVPRELLEQKNKELLLEKASTFALFDKSVSVISCKTVVNTVRDYLGRTGIGPVADLDKSLKAAVAKLLSQSENDDDSAMDAEQIEKILQTVEDIQRTLTRADSLSYSARRDYTSLNNFPPDQTATVLADSTSNLQQCKATVQTAVLALRDLTAMLPKDPTP